MLGHRQVHASKSRPLNNLSQWAARESEARLNAEQFSRPVAKGLRATPLQADESTPANDLSASAGQPLALPQRKFFEGQFGYDFSQVRVHADASAAQLADEASAKAFTTGNHIVFGSGKFKPGTREGAALMAHELTHVVQQSDAPGNVGGATQREPKQPKQGIGSAPPSEPVIIAKDVAPEDDFILFDQDSANVSTSEKKLSQIFGIYAMPVTIELHGYASREGDTDYNSKLSGHRAAALKAKALKFLPPGSQVVLYAHGATEAFGATKDNRRVGIKLVLDATPDTSKDPTSPCPPGRSAKDRDLLTFDPIDPSLSKPTLPGSTLPFGCPPTLFPSTTIPPNFTLPPLSGPSLMDWSETTSPFTARGLRLTDSEAKTIEANWWTTYNFLRSLGFRPDLAALGANKGTAFAYDNMLSRENPNAADRFEQDSDKQLSLQNPGQKGIGTKIVPIITPSTLEWLSKKVFKKDLKFTF